MGTWDFMEQKQRMRAFVLPDYPIRNGIWLPAATCHCLNLANARGLLFKLETGWCVEKDAKIFVAMCRTLEANNIQKANPFFGDLVKLRPKRIDYGFFDFPGGISATVGKWMNCHLSPVIVHNSTIAVTQILARRNNVALKNQDTWLRTSYGSKLRAAYGNLDIRHQRVLMLLHRIFCDWDFEIQPDDNGSIPVYGDLTHRMMVLKMQKFRKVSRDKYPSFMVDCSATRVPQYS